MRAEVQGLGVDSEFRAFTVAADYSIFIVRGLGFMVQAPCL